MRRCILKAAKNHGAEPACSIIILASFQSWLAEVYCRIRTGGDQLWKNAPWPRGKVTAAAVQLLNEPASSALITACGSVLFAVFVAWAMMIVSPKPFSEE